MDKATYEKQLITNVIESIEQHGGKDCLTSIILTGSFGRGEPTYTVSGDGNVILKSDVEIALIFPKTTKKQAVMGIIDAVSSAFAEDLNLMPVNEVRVRKAYNFNYSLLIPKYKTIFTYDLFNGSHTIWGEQIIENQKISLAQVDKYEAKRLVANRIGELVYLHEHTADNDKTFLMAQWKGKVLLAIVSAWLILEDKYISSYHGQCQIVHDNEKTLLSIFENKFIDDYDRIFTFLRENGDFYEIPDNRLKKYVNTIELFFNSKHLNTPKVNSLSRKFKYCAKYVKTGCHYGLFSFEDNILQALITDYCCSNDSIVKDAEVWHKVLY